MPTFYRCSWLIQETWLVHWPHLSRLLCSLDAGPCSLCIPDHNTDICLSMLHAVYIVKLTIQIAKLLYTRRTSSACEQTGLSGLLEKALHSVSNLTFLCNLPVCLALSLTQQGAHLVSFPDTFWYKTSTHYEIVGYKLLTLICAM